MRNLPVFTFELPKSFASPDFLLLVCVRVCAHVHVHAFLCVFLNYFLRPSPSSLASLLLATVFNIKHADSRFSASSSSIFSLPYFLGAKGEVEEGAEEEGGVFWPNK